MKVRGGTAAQPRSCQRRRLHRSAPGTLCPPLCHAGVSPGMAGWTMGELAIRRGWGHSGPGVGLGLVCNRADGPVEASPDPPLDALQPVFPGNHRVWPKRQHQSAAGWGKILRWMSFLLLNGHRVGPGRAGRGALPLGQGADRSVHFVPS